MIQDLSATLQKMLIDSGLTSPLIVFDRPGEGFSPTQTTIDLFLHDIRENMELRSNEPTVTRQNGQAMIQRPPIRIDCTYLITAWPASGTETALLLEHQLLGQVLQVLSKYPTIPKGFLQGSLKGQQLPVPLVTARMDATKSTHEFWTAIGGRLRPSITVTATIAIDTNEPPIEAPLVMEAVTRVDLLRIRGKVIDSDEKPVIGAKVALVEIGAVAITDSGGNYILGSMSMGNYTLHVETSSGVTKDIPVTIPAKDGNRYDVKL